MTALRSGFQAAARQLFTEEAICCLRSGGSVDISHPILQCFKSERYLVWRVRAGSKVTGSSCVQRIMTESLGGSGAALRGPLAG